MKVYTGGTFDLFHAGHVNFLRQCSHYGEVVVALNTDEFVKEYKGFYPIYPYFEREVLLRACVYVSDVVPNIAGKDSKPSILAVMPDYICIGDDWQHKDYYKQMGFDDKWLREHGITLKYLPYTQGVSTTDIKNRICQK